MVEEERCPVARAAGYPSLRLPLLALICIAAFLHLFFASYSGIPLSLLRPQEAFRNATSNSSTTTQQQQQVLEKEPEDRTSNQLRYDWTNLPVMSPLAKRIETHMTNCSLPLGHFQMINRWGLGSDLHVWSQVLCNGMEEGVRVWSSPPWQWLDEAVCGNNVAASFSCYFPLAEMQCQGDYNVARNNVNNRTTISEIANPYGVLECPGILRNKAEIPVPDFRASVMEYLFRSVSPAVVQEAERQLNVVFPRGKVPPGLITVHIRWGDKSKEMKLVPAQDYVQAIQKILDGRQNNNDVSIYLATEDPKAVKAFQEAAPKQWDIYLDQYFHDMLPYRQEADVWNQGPKSALATKGRAGLIALASVLVAMEANDFVLTTASNWSRLMNELRKNVVDPRCNNCTHMVDLRSGEW